MPYGVVFALFAVLTGTVWSLAPTLLGVPDAATAPVQTALTIAWCALGATAMIAGARRASQATWNAGAIVATAALAKAFLVDRGFDETNQAIVFITLGVVLTAAGALAPRPVARARDAEPASPEVRR